MCAYGAHYAGGRIIAVQRDDDVFLVPFIEDERAAFLKTIIPVRKASKQYLGEGSDELDGEEKELRAPFTWMRATAPAA
jgi:hypothetical protein